MMVCLFFVFFFGGGGGSGGGGSVCQCPFLWDARHKCVNT